MQSVPTLFQPLTKVIAFAPGSSVETLRERQGTLLPFDNTVCPGKRGARSRAAAYVLYQIIEFLTLLVRRPFSRATYRRFAEPWGLKELVPGRVYRSAEPRAMHLTYLKKLGIQTLVCVKRTLPTERTLAHAVEHDLSVARIDLGADGNISPYAIQQTVDIIMRAELGPILLHCDGGRHRTGIVTAALRRAQGWSLEQALDEYEQLAAPAPRIADGIAIARYFAHCDRQESRT